MPSINSNSSDKPSLLTSDVLSFGKKRVSHWFAWFLIGLLFGIPIGVVLVANQNGDFDLSFAESPSFVVQHEDLTDLTIQLLRVGDSMAKTSGLPAPDDETGGAIGSNVNVSVSDTSVATDEISSDISDTIDGDGTSDIGDTDGQARGAFISGPELTHAITLAQKRQALMVQALQRNDPATVLKFAIPKKMRAKFAPEVQQYLETEADMSGEFTILHSENVDASGNFTDSKYFYSLKTAGQETLDLHFAGIQPPEAATKKLLTGARVRVKGVKVGQAVAALGADTAALQVLAAAPLATSFGTQKVGVLMVIFRGWNVHPDLTIANVRDMVFNRVNKFFGENSYGQARFEGDVFQITVDPPCYNGNGYGLSSYYNQIAASQGINLSPYQRLVYVSNIGCGRGGAWGSIGGNPSIMWTAQYSFGLSETVFEHELGHNFTLWHSHALACNGVSLGAPDNCFNAEYGDGMDVMGTGNHPSQHFNAGQKENIYWLNSGQSLLSNQSPPITTVTTSGTYPLDPYISQTNGPKALKFVATNGNVFYVEYRRNSVFTTNQIDGLAIHLRSFVTFFPSYSGNMYLLDPTPGIGPVFSVVPLGQTFAIPGTSYKITPTALTSTGATVSVTLGTTPPPVCTRANPSLSISPLAQFGKPGDALAYAASVTNNDTSVCATSNFSLSGSGLPVGWTISSSSLNLVPGASSNTAVIVTSPVNAAAQSYTFTLTAKNSSETSKFASATATYNVQPTVKAQCEDGIDNDGDGKIDYPADPGCLSASDTDESDTPTTATMSDDFNRTNSANLGAKWQEAKGGFAIANNELRNDANITGSSIALASGISGSSLSATASFARTDSSGGEFGLVLRYQDANNYYRFYRKTGGTSVFRIGKVVNGVETVLKGVATSNPTTNTFFTLEAKAEGTKLTLYLNGVKKIELNDTTFSQGGVGLNLNSLRSQRVDNFSASVLTP